MRKEYLFVAEPDLEKALGKAFAHTEAVAPGTYLISNIKTPAAEIHAPEINFYLQNSLDTEEEKVAGIQSLYHVRSIEFSLARDVELEANYGQNLLLIGENVQPEVNKELERNGFIVTVAHPEEIDRLTGEIGQFSLQLHDRRTLNADQILWGGAPETLLGVKGIYDTKLHGAEKVLCKFTTKPGVVVYKKSVSHDVSLCPSQDKDDGICERCIAACPARAIKKFPDTKQIQINHMLCDDCGACTAACPSGAMEYLPLPQESFSRICSFYRKKTALILPRRMDIVNLLVTLPPHTLPLTVADESFLDDYHLLSFVQTSGRPVVIFSNWFSQALQDAAGFLNEIFLRKYGSQAVFLCEDEASLEKNLRSLPDLEGCTYPEEEGGQNKRRIFSKRLKYLVGGEDLGTLSVPLAFGNVSVDKNRCTLCLACVGVCRPGALTAWSADNSLRFIPSLCTACGSCLHVCPEPDCLHLEEGTLTLAPQFFQANIMAQDQLMDCAQCGKLFAPRKSIEKIAAIMGPFFSGDPIRMKTLYCCSDCKARIMIEKQLSDNMNFQ